MATGSQGLLSKPRSALEANDPQLIPTPRELLRGGEIYEVRLLERRPDRESDTPFASLYRIYEHFMLDQHIEIRNELEAFRFHREWTEIPDPKDANPERNAVLAVIPKLLVLAFNKRIDLGLPRNAPSIFTHDQLDEWRKQDRPRKMTPSWAQEVPPCKEVLKLAHWDNEVRRFVTIDSFDDKRASKQFREKNILIWEPQIHFI